MASLESQIKNLSDEEALSLLASLCFTVNDLRAVEKLGGAHAVVALYCARGQADHLLCPKNLREEFDRFYQSGGFLLTPWRHLSCRLFRAKNAPLAFFGRHNQALIFDQPSIAIVGARDASCRGILDAEKIAGDLARQSITVISGGARGIDKAAHRQALQAGGSTIVVSGVRCHFGNDFAPELNFPHDQNCTAIIYPFGPFLPQKKFMFVERNRFVVAHAHAVVVVEGKAGSGTLHTARFAHQLKCPIFTWKRTSDDAHSYVPHRLLRVQKATDMEYFTQFAEALVTNKPKPPKRRDNPVIENMRKAEAKDPLPYLLQIINDHENSLGIDDLLDLTGLSFQELQRDLLGYQLQGRIFKQGTQFVLTDR